MIGHRLKNWKLPIVPGVAVLLGLGFVFGRALQAVTAGDVATDHVVSLMVAMFVAFWLGTRWEGTSNAEGVSTS